MNKFQNIIGLVGAILSLLLGGCTSVDDSEQFDPDSPDPMMRAGVTFDPLDVSVSLDPALLQPSSAPYLLGVGDKVEIEISGIEGTRATTFILPDGKLYFDLAGGVAADGLTVKELAQLLEEHLKRDYSSPTVNVNLVEVNSRRYWVLGRVFNPGLYPLKQPTTLLEAISQAGGLFTSRFSGSTEELADLGNSFVIRNGQVLPIDFDALLRKGDMRNNIYLQANDYVYLPSALSQSVHVLGHVRLPQAIGYKDRLTIVGAIAAVNGTIPGANIDQVVIVRGSLTTPKVAVVNLGAIISGQQPNIELRPGDIVWVPRDPWEKISEYFWQIATTAAQTIAIREGAWAVDSSADSRPVIPIQ